MTTTRLTHASPAAAYSNSVGRWYETYVPTECNGIQKPLNQQFIDNSKYFNVTFAGGLDYFDEKLITEWQQQSNGRKFVKSRRQLNRNRYQSIQISPYKSSSINLWTESDFKRLSVFYTLVLSI